MFLDLKFVHILFALQLKKISNIIIDLSIISETIKTGYLI